MSNPKREAGHRTSSTTVAIGTATLFLALAGLASFLADDRNALGGAWRLRGALIPTAEAGAAAGRLARPTLLR